MTNFNRSTLPDTVRSKRRDPEPVVGQRGGVIRCILVPSKTRTATASAI